MSPSQAEIVRHYAQFQVLTAPHPKLIVMLHARSAEMVATAANELDPIRRRELLEKARKIISRLLSALITGDPVSKSLYYLYDYCLVLVVRGTDDDCARALNILKTLRDTFKELLRSV
jgi:flagellin-specific chaperone FliS